MGRVYSTFTKEVDKLSDGANTTSNALTADSVNAVQAAMHAGAASTCCYFVTLLCCYVVLFAKL